MNHRDLHPVLLWIASISVLSGPGLPMFAQAVRADRPDVCEAYRNVPIPPEIENVSVPQEPPTCASYRSYRGIGRARNLSQAFQCAALERKANLAGPDQSKMMPTPWVVGGGLILADMYFNGSGVSRNIPLAYHFMCEQDAGIAKLAMEYLAKPDYRPASDGPFEFCDYADTTVAMNFCSNYALQLADERRNRYFISIQNKLTGEQKSAFERLLVSEKAYREAHAREVDQGGSIRVIRTIGSMNILADLFRTDLVQFERNEWKFKGQKLPEGADRLMDRQLIETNNNLKRHTKEELQEGLVSFENLEYVQHAWTEFRDAWDRFARLRYPDGAAEVHRRIVLERYRLLKTIS